MTVEKLIEMLKKYNPNNQVMLWTAEDKPHVITAMALGYNNDCTYLYDEEETEE